MTKDRELRYFDWKYERIDILEILNTSVSQYSILRKMSIPIKAYQVVEHGQTPEEVLETITLKDVKASFEEFRQKIFKEKGWTSWQTGIGGVFFDKGQPKLFIPMLDLEIVSTPNLIKDTMSLENGLRKLDVDGSIVRSGDVGMGSYFFVGHDPQNYFPNYWQFMGNALISFTVGDNENTKKARYFGSVLSKAQTKEESVVIADEILACFPSIKTGQEREGLLVDPRWIGHKLKDGFTILRQTPGKNYEDKPLQVAGFY
jgi:hypothetical protein